MPKPVIELSISRDKIDKDLCFKGKNGLVLDIALFPNKDGQPGKYGDDGFVSQKPCKEAREAGKQGVIIGNWKWVEKPAEQAPGTMRPIQQKRPYNLRPNTPDQRPKPPVDPELDAPEDSNW